MIITRRHYEALLPLANQLRQELAAMTARQESDEVMRPKQAELIALEIQLGNWLERATGGRYYQAYQIITRAMGAAHDSFEPCEVQFVETWFLDLVQEITQLNLSLEHYLTLATVLEMDNELEPDHREMVEHARKTAGEPGPIPE